MPPNQGLINPALKSGLLKNGDNTNYFYLATLRSKSFHSPVLFSYCVRFELYHGFVIRSFIYRYKFCLNTNFAQEGVMGPPVMVLTGSVWYS